MGNPLMEFDLTRPLPPELDGAPCDRCGTPATRYYRSRSSASNRFCEHHLRLELERDRLKVAANIVGYQERINSLQTLHDAYTRATAKSQRRTQKELWPNE